MQELENVKHRIGANISYGASAGVLFGVGSLITHGGVMGGVVTLAATIGLGAFGGEINNTVKKFTSMPGSETVEEEFDTDPAVECVRTTRTFKQRLLNQFPDEEFDTGEVAAVTTSRSNGTGFLSNTTTATRKFPATSVTELMARGFKPHPTSLVLALGEQSKPIRVDPRIVAHIGVPGRTRVGKTNAIRFWTMQLLVQPSTHVFFLTPAWAPQTVDPDGKMTDFRALETLFDRTEDNSGAIRKFINVEVLGELNHRLTVRRGKLIEFDHLWIVLDELPTIIEQCNDPVLIRSIGTILRLGAQVNIHLMVSSQDFQVQTIGIKTGAQSCFTTVVAPDIDTYSQPRLFGEEPIDLSHIKGKEKGNVIIRVDGDIYYGRVPYVDNQSTYSFLGVDQRTVVTHPVYNDAEDYGSGDFGPEVITAPGQERIQPEEEYYAPRQKVVVPENGDVEEWWMIHAEYKEGSVVATWEAFNHYGEWCEARGYNAVEKTPFSHKFSQLAATDGYVQTSKGQKQSPARKHLALSEVYVEVEEVC